MYWGTLSALTMFVTTPGEFYTLRFLSIGIDFSILPTSYAISFRMPTLIKSAGV